MYVLARVSVQRVRFRGNRICLARTASLVNSMSVRVSAVLVSALLGLQDHAHLSSSTIVSAWSAPLGQLSCWANEKQNKQLVPNCLPKSSSIQTTYKTQDGASEGGR